MQSHSENHHRAALRPILAAAALLPLLLSALPHPSRAETADAVLAAADAHCIVAPRCGTRSPRPPGEWAYLATAEKARLESRVRSGTATARDGQRLIDLIRQWPDLRKAIAEHRSRHHFVPVDSANAKSGAIGSGRGGDRDGDSDRDSDADDGYAAADLLYVFDAIRRAEPNNPHHACDWAQRAEPEIAEAELRRALREQPASQPLRACLARILDRAGRGEEAFEIAAGAADHEPDEWTRSLHRVLPHAFRARWYWATFLHDPQAELEILEQAAEALSGDGLETPHALRMAIIRNATWQRAGYDPLADLLNLLAEEPPLSLHAEICPRIDYIGHRDLHDGCWDALASRLDPSSPTWNEEVAPLAAEKKFLPINRARQWHAARAIETRDFARLREALSTRPDPGIENQWAQALHLLETSTALETSAALEISAAPGARDKERVEGRTETADPETPSAFEKGCELLGRTIREGLGARTAENAGTCPWRYQGLERLLVRCGLDAEAATMAEGLEPHSTELDDPLLRILGESFGPARALVIAELERRLLIPGSDPRLFGTLGEILRPSALVADALGEPAEEWIAFLRRFLEVRPDHLLARNNLLRTLDRVYSEDRETHLRPALEEAVTALPDHVDLRLWQASEALLANDLRTARQGAEWVLDGDHRRRITPQSEVETTPRQIADANYLLGRIARLEGRLEDASQHLEIYFSRRFEYRSCPSSAIPCDRAFRWHLYSVGDWPALERYGVERRAAEEIGLERMAQRNPGVPVEQWPLQVRRAFAARADALLADTSPDPWTGDRPCAAASALPHLESLAIARPGAPGLEERLRRTREMGCEVEADFDIDAFFAANERQLLDSMRQLF